MLCFAFGAELDPDVRRQRFPEHRVLGLAGLRDHQLAFPRFSPEWNGGIAGIQTHHGDTLWGIVYDVNEAGLAALDRVEGFRSPGDAHNVSERQVVLVELKRPDDGSVPRRLRVYVYVPRPSNPSPPSPAYRDAIVRGARHHALPEEYLPRLEGLPVRSEATGA
jgi:hypothetical protein